MRFDSDAGPSPSINTVREVTVKSFSPTRHIKRPGVHLLSVVTPHDYSPAPPSLADAPCFLPDHHVIHGSIYKSVIILTLIVLFISNVYFKRDLSLGSSLSLNKKRTLDGGAHQIPTPNPSLAPPVPWSDGNNNYGHSPGHLTPKPPRTPRSLAPIQTQLRSPRPSTSNRSSVLILSPIVYPDGPNEEEQEEPDDMYPPQYAVRRDINEVRRSGEDWTMISRSQEEAEHGPTSASSPRFLSTRPSVSSNSYDWAQPGMQWSWSSFSFVFRGPTRRMRSVVLTTLDVLGLYRRGVGRGRGTGYLGLLWDMLADARSVAWPVALVWCVFEWWMLH